MRRRRLFWKRRHAWLARSVAVESYFDEMTNVYGGVPVREHVHEGQRAVRDAALAYGDAARSVRLVRVIPRPTVGAIGQVQQSALAVFETVWEDPFRAPDLTPLAQHALGCLVARHPDLLHETDVARIKALPEAIGA